MTNNPRTLPVQGPVTTPAPLDSSAITLFGSSSVTHPITGLALAFPGYEIVEELGRGGMGVVYKARQLSVNRMVALKVILGGPLASTGDKARMHLEAEAAGRLQHPNIVQVFDVGEYLGFSFIALELIDGQNLRRWQDERPLDPLQAARIVAQVARAVQHAHDHGIVHRDLKPANILLAPAPAADSTRPSGSGSGSGRGTGALGFVPKVTDFGLAKRLEPGADLTTTGGACGTPNYMAPEQVRGGPLGSAVDVYGLGALLFELLTGRPPFVGTSATDVMNQIVGDDAPSARRLVPSVPRDLAVIAAKCLEKKPGLRYATARDLADDLDRYHAGLPITARPLGVPGRAARWMRRNPVPAAFLLLTTLGCAVTGTLAVELARAGTEERKARAEAEAATAEATRQRLVAEAATAEAERARAAADREAATARAERRSADEARARAEGHLQRAGGVITGSIRDLSRMSGFRDDAFRDARASLITRVREYRDSIAPLAAGSPKWLEVLADVSHFVAFLEYTNQNHERAAAEYRAAAAANEKVAGLVPDGREARARASYSLLSAGNAFTNAGRYRDAETCYRESIALIDPLCDPATAPPVRFKQAAETWHQLGNLHRAEGKPDLWVRAAETELARAAGAVKLAPGDNVALRIRATAELHAAQAHQEAGQGPAAEGLYAAALATRAQVRARPGNWVGAVEQATAEHAEVAVARAGFLARRGNRPEAEAAFAAAIKDLEGVCAGVPESAEFALMLAKACERYGVALVGWDRVPEAERHFDRTLRMLAPFVRRGGTHGANETWLAAATARAHILNTTGRHREAAAEWARLAEYDPKNRIGHELFVAQSHAYAGDRKAASAVAGALMKQPLDGSDWLDLARVWCLVAAAARGDAEAIGSAHERSVACLERARAAGTFQNPDRLKWYAERREFDPVRGRFDPHQK